MSRDDTNQLKRTIDLGLQAQAFLMSDVGRYLIARAEEQIADRVEAMKVVDPEDAKAVRVLQNDIRVAESVQYWLADAITAGQNAEQEFIDQHN